MSDAEIAEWLARLDRRSTTLAAVVSVFGAFAASWLCDSMLQKWGVSAWSSHSVSLVVFIALCVVISRRSMHHRAAGTVA